MSEKDRENDLFPMSKKDREDGLFPISKKDREDDLFPMSKKDREECYVEELTLIALIIFKFKKLGKNLSCSFI